jgi:hypothetical protein
MTKKLEGKIAVINPRSLLSHCLLRNLMSMRGTVV